jgi:hypothetical protein
MLSRKLLALAAVSLVASSAAASAQNAQPLSLSTNPSVARSGAELGGAGELRGGYGWIVALIGLAAAIAIISQLGKNPQLPGSP